MDKMSRIIQIQERVISELVCFEHDCLDKIFAIALAKTDKIAMCK